MNTYDYLIVGGGMTADAAVRGIRELDQKGRIGILSSEADPPYARPPLSKGLWSGKKSVAEIDCGTEARGVTLMLGRTVTELHRNEHCVVDDTNRVYRYNRLLLATGGSPRRLPVADDSVVYYRTLADYRKVAGEMADKQSYAVIGGGFIGSEMAAALVGQGKTVTMIYPGNALAAGIFPEVLARQLSSYYRDQGVTLLEGHKLSNLAAAENGLSVHLEDGQLLEVDAVVAGIGIEPNTGLAEQAGLEVDNGILVDARLRTSADAIYSAGDVANFHNPALDCRMRVEHEDNALTMGFMAGRNMAGAEEVYDHLPFFYSDLFDVGYEAVGELDASLETVGIGNGLHDPGIRAYLRDGQVRGVLLWNLFGQVEAGRNLITGRERFSAPEIEARLRQLLQAAGEE